MKVKLRLYYFLMRSGLLAKGDICTDVDGYVTDIEDDSFACDWNQDDMENSKCHIKSFAPRENNGSQPVSDDFPVEVTSDSLADLDEWQVNAGQFDWHFSDVQDNIKSWKPDIEKLIEQQIEYDKTQLKEQFKNGPQGVVEGLEQPIEELIINAKGNNMPVYTQEMKDAGKYAPVGSKVQIVNTGSFDLEYGDDVLGLEVTVKSDPVSIGKGNIIQVVEYAGIAYCFETDMIFPFKSREEVEMEEAKRNQICDRVSLYMEEYESGDSLYDLLELMQGNGHLDEIILPLEPNQ